MQPCPPARPQPPPPKGPVPHAYCLPIFTVTIQPAAHVSSSGIAFDAINPRRGSPALYCCDKLQQNTARHVLVYLVHFLHHSVPPASRQLLHLLFSHIVHPLTFLSRERAPLPTRLARQPTRARRPPVPSLHQPVVAVANPLSLSQVASPPHTNALTLPHPLPR